ncbi:MAG: cytochrome c-type biogenesis protein CcmH [Alphaproteobacteria bacterium]|nr:cytochrome c-type biogenesis protein CcmH [Alphaproteobacteria bacterium]
MTHRLAFIGLWALLSAGVVHAAQPPTEVGLIEGIAPGAPPPPGEVDARAREIGAGLRCPVCQGLSVSDSNSAAALQMQGRIRDLVAAGYDREAIEDYFVSKYGEWVLLAPRSRGAWLLPLAAGVIALGVLGLRLRGGEDDDAGPDTMVDERHPAPMDDPYRARLRAEVDDDR